MNTTARENLQLITLKQHPEHRDIFDILLMTPEELLSYDAIELDFHFYPYSRDIKWTDYTLAPYEEEIRAGQHSTYEKMIDPYAVGCGLWIGFALLAVVGKLNPSDLAGVESLVTLAIATYWWNTVVRPIIEKWLIQLSENYPVQRKQRYYDHVAKLPATSRNYLEHARKLRYWIERLLPAYMSLELGSNSSILRLKINTKQLESHENTVNIGTFRFGGDNIVDNLREFGFQFGVHVKLSQKKSLLHYKDELLQTIFKDTVGVLVDGVEQANTIEVRETISLGRIKYYKYRGLLKGILVGKELNR